MERVEQILRNKTTLDNLKLIQDDGMTWITTKDSLGTVVFPTAEEFLEVVQALNIKEDKEVTEEELEKRFKFHLELYKYRMEYEEIETIEEMARNSIKPWIQRFKDTAKEGKEVLGNLENVALYIRTGMIDKELDWNSLTVKEQTTLGKLDGLFLDWSMYCFLYNVHPEHLVKPYIESVIPNVKLHDNTEIYGNIILEPDAPEQYWFISDDEWSVGDDQLIYNLTPEEQLLALKELEDESNTNEYGYLDVYNTVYFKKALVLILEEILATDRTY